MRCTRAQQWMAAVVDGEVSLRRRRALDRHLAACAVCRREQVATERLLAALGALPGEAVVPARLEQDTLRRVRVAAAEGEELAAERGWWGALRLPAFALAGAAVLALGVGLLREAGPGRGGAPAAEKRVARGAGAEHGAPVAPPARSEVANRPRVTPPPRDPPPELAAAPDLFVNLPILRNMEKLDNFEAIRTTTIEDAPPAPGERSNG